MPKADRSARDAEIIARIAIYCLQTEEALTEIDGSFERFMHSHTYQNAVAMCILQIGELAKQLSATFIAAHPQLPWQAIIKTRDYYTHHYGNLDFALVWTTATEDIPSVKQFCIALSDQQANRR